MRSTALRGYYFFVILYFQVLALVSDLLGYEKSTRLAYFRNSPFITSKQGHTPIGGARVQTDKKRVARSANCSALTQ